MIGTPGGGPDVRNLRGGAKAAQESWLLKLGEILMTNPNLIGTRNCGPDVRYVPGGAVAAQEAFDYLSVAATPCIGTESSAGRIVVLPGKVGWVGL